MSNCTSQDNAIVLSAGSNTQLSASDMAWYKQLDREPAMEAEHVFLQLIDGNHGCISAQSALQEGLALKVLENICHKREE